MSRATVCDPSSEMSEADFAEPAEVFVSRGMGRRGGLAYRRFAMAREAIAFAVEEFPAGPPDGVVMVVGDKRFDLAAMRTLHREDRARSPDAQDGD